jgi:hydroxymethylpyrimidine pyrophosphatase-like HAD family hydrolase
MPARLLVAIDLDGTLLRDDKTIAPEDAAAIRAAMARGVAVTLATGRLTTNTLPFAADLGLTTPLICADGGLLVDPRSGAAIERRAIPTDRATAAIEVMEANDLAAYLFLEDAIHCGSPGERHRGYVDTWSREIVVHPFPSLLGAGGWRLAPGVSLTVGIGTEPAVERAWRQLEHQHGDALDSVYFAMRGTNLWAIRSLPRGCDKGEMLATLAARLALPHTRVAAVGDWLNDLGMFAYAGRSFAMAQAPEEVRRAATDLLRSSSATGGGVAEALAALLR